MEFEEREYHLQELCVLLGYSYSYFRHNRKEFEEYLSYLFEYETYLKGRYLYYNITKVKKEFIKFLEWKKLKDLL